MTDIVDKEKDNQDGNKDKDKLPESIPYDRFKQVNDQFKETQKKLEKLEADQKKREQEEEEKRQKALSEQQQYQKLANEYKAKLDDLSPKFESNNERIERPESVLTTYADAQLSIVPEIYQDLVKALPLIDRLEWLTNNKDKLQPEQGQPQKTGIPQTPNGKGNGQLSDIERRRKAARTF